MPNLKTKQKTQNFKQTVPYPLVLQANLKAYLIFISLKTSSHPLRFSFIYAQHLFALSIWEDTFISMPGFCDFKHYLGVTSCGKVLAVHGDLPSDCVVSGSAADMWILWVSFSLHS